MPGRLPEIITDDRAAMIESSYVPLPPIAQFGPSLDEALGMTPLEIRQVPGKLQIAGASQLNSARRMRILTGHRQAERNRE